MRFCWVLGVSARFLVFVVFWMFLRILGFLFICAKFVWLRFWGLSVFGVFCLVLLVVGLAACVWGVALFGLFACGV